MFMIHDAPTCKICVKQFVGKNGSEIFALLEGKIQTLKEEEEDKAHLINSAAPYKDFNSLIANTV